MKLGMKLTFTMAEILFEKREVSFTYLNVISEPSSEIRFILVLKLPKKNKMVGT